MQNDIEKLQRRAQWLAVLDEKPEKYYVKNIIICVDWLNFGDRICSRIF